MTALPERRGLSGFLPMLRRWPAATPPNGAAAAARSRASTPPGGVFRSAALSGFLEAVAARPAAELIDLGPVIGSNIAFLGEQVGCKIHVKDLYADLDRHIEQGIVERFPHFIQARFALPAESIDGVLCWDLFDDLASDAREVLAAELVRMLRPGGVLLGLFATSARRETLHAKYVIEDAQHLRHHVHAAAAGRCHRVLQNRDVLKLFEALHVRSAVLLKFQLREILFRKPGSPGV